MRVLLLLLFLILGLHAVVVADDSKLLRSETNCALDEWITSRLHPESWGLLYPSGLRSLLGVDGLRLEQCCANCTFELKEKQVTAIWVFGHSAGQNEKESDLKSVNDSLIGRMGSLSFEDVAFGEGFTWFKAKRQVGKCVEKVALKKRRGILLSWSVTRPVEKTGDLFACLSQFPMTGDTLDKLKSYDMPSWSRGLVAKRIKLGGRRELNIVIDKPNPARQAEVVAALKRVGEQEGFVDKTERGTPLTMTKRAGSRILLIRLGEVLGDVDSLRIQIDFGPKSKAPDSE